MIKKIKPNRRSKEEKEKRRKKVLISQYSNSPIRLLLAKFNISYPENRFYDSVLLDLPLSEIKAVDLLGGGRVSSTQYETWIEIREELIAVIYNELNKKENEKNFFRKKN